MARVLVRREIFERGQFPPVCCKTGERAEFYDRFEFSNTPSWTWILLLFGVLPFLIATAFATQRFSGVLPISQRARRRIRTARRSSWVLGLVAIFVGAASLVAGSRWVYLGAALVAAWLVAIALVALWTPNANLRGEAVALSNVDAAFVGAITEVLPATTVGGGDDLG